jgi:hypothetical protein
MAAAERRSGLLPVDGILARSRSTSEKMKTTLDGEEKGRNVVAS